MICWRANTLVQSERQTERVREDASGDREDGEDDDELPCVIGESEGDCLWRGSRRSVGSSFHRQGAGYWKERLVIFKEDRVGVGLRARVTVDEERVLRQGWTVGTSLSKETSMGPTLCNRLML